MKHISEFVRPDPLPKYFAIDVDGTFYTKDEGVFRRNVEAFKLLKDKGITPFLCTARDPVSNKQILGSYFISKTNYVGYPGSYANGSLIYDSDGNLIKISKLSDRFLSKFKDHASLKNINNNVIYLTDTGLYSLDDLSQSAIDYINSKSMSYPLKTTYEDLKQKNVVSIIIVKDPVDDFELINEVSYVKYNKGNLSQISPRGCSKKMGVEAILTHFKSNANECAYIGDNTNDREAMEFCKTSFAVGNADDETKRKAKWVLDVNYDQGAFEKAVCSLYNRS